jgi:ATP-dependent protease ClpP protease subunit
MKKLITSICLSLALVLGCAGMPDVKEPKQVSSRFHKLADGNYIMTGGVYENSYEEFYKITSSGQKEYTIIIMTSGGDAASTVGIMNRIEILQDQGVKFRFIVPAKAFSAGAYMFMMGDERIMHRGSQLMWHTMTGQSDHDKVFVKEDSVILRKNWDNFVYDKFRELFPHLDKVWVDEIFWNSGMSWMTAEQALLMGIATKIIN